MLIVDDFSEGTTFDLIEPTVPSVPFVFSAPHSGTTYPKSLLSRARLDRLTLRRSEDTFVDELFAGVPSLGAPLMRAHFPRVFLDLNRCSSEIDPSMFDAPPPLPMQADSPRVASGLGVIARIVGEGQEIYASHLPAAEAEDRLTRFYHPYHNALSAQLATHVEHFGAAVLVDCHSMPSGAIRHDVGDPNRIDVVLGDRYGTSCSGMLSEEFARLLRDQGLTVGRNRPYAGGFITERYGHPPMIHAIQIEINRALYMNEATFERNAGFDALRLALMATSARLIDWFMAHDAGVDWQQAAE
ncbi:N-formylglutamate amidohydrolase [Acuticoccus sp. I52.16.1]|uniref:N-formylglutamate amidohydrolase n=1 Tax=Acuticoccus sp. I52.16.1 TaxID=2928472 RepID=UPI001FCFE711|nr:N-formylglutamate amidohydrolase [Acuticoccus sp. I52.16.1]UOM33542.1 N-formylglutamate amidohydrolase [Acuticoccus sp. I52.16.1]